MSAAPSPGVDDPGRAGRGLLTHAVGAGHHVLNRPGDVRLVQHLLNLAVAGASPMDENGRCDAILIERIKAFQVKTLHFQVGDGRVDPGGRTLAALLGAAASAARPKPPPPSTPWYAGAVNAFDVARTTAEEDWRKLESYFIRARAAPSSVPKPPPHIDRPAAASTSGRLTDEDFRDAASRIGPNVSPILVHAFARVESGGQSGMGPAGLPIIAYEGHWFRDYTKHVYDKTHPLLSYPYRRKAGPEWQHNNKTQETAWQTLKAAAALNETAAYESCSWGMFQVMGFNYRMCQYTTVQDFVAAMKAGERSQLDAFIKYSLGTPGMANAMARKDYAGMAARYNGTDYGDYDRQIEQCYKKMGGT